MTEMQELIQAKSDAVIALATALNSAIDSGELENLRQVQGYLRAWAAGVSAVTPTARPGRLQPEKDGQPPIGTTMVDKDGDFWTRVNDGGWARSNTPSMDIDGAYTWSYLQRYAPLTPRS